MPTLICLLCFTLTYLVRSAEDLGNCTPLCQGIETKIETGGVHLNLQRGIGSIGGITLTNSQGVEQMQRRELVCASLWCVPSTHCTIFSPWGAWRTCPTQWPSWQWDVTLRPVRTKSEACSTLPRAQGSSPGPPSSGPSECHLGHLSRGGWTRTVHMYVYAIGPLIERISQAW